MQEYIDSLQLPLKGDLTGDKYEIEFTSSDMFDKFYLIFSRYDFFNFDEDDSSISLEGATLHFVDEENGYEVTLIANYVDDEYTCTVEKK